MTQTPSFRDVEKLSAYLDGQLKPSEITRLESRLRSDPELASVLRDLRQARGLLRQLPQRRAPRNFTLTPQMVGQKPPLPRTYPIFRFATALATLLLFFTFVTNFMAPHLVRSAAPYPPGIGGYGGGGGPESEMTMEAAPEQQAAPALAAPAATEPPVEAPAAPPVPLPTEMPPSAEDNARAAPEPTVQPSEKSGVQAPPTGEALAQQAAPNETEQARKPAHPISALVQVVLAGIAVLSGLVALLLRIFAIRQWRAKTK